MTQTARAFSVLLRQLLREPVLAASLLVPVPAALLLRLGLPILETTLTPWLHPGWLGPYYLLTDLLIALLPPLLLSYTTIMVMLEEADTGIIRCLAVTPVTRRGYLLSRLVWPGLIAAAYSALLLFLCGLTGPPPHLALTLGGMAAVLGVQMALVTLALSSNKVDGLALVKLSSVLILGLPVPFFFSGNVQYAAALLPSFWMAKLAAGHAATAIPAFCATAGLWLYPLYCRFASKVL